jgi:hypothetical protein
MARLLQTSYPLPEYDINHRGPLATERSAVAFEKLRAEREVVQFGVADGYASYLVVSRKPLTLQHIAYMDGYQIPYAHIRGLRLADVEFMLQREGKVRQMFAAKK